MRLRPEVRRFAEAMEAKLRQHDKARGDSWEHSSFPWLEGRLRHEMKEFRHALRERSYGDLDDLKRVRCEAADVGNFLMFIVEVLGQQSARANP